MTKLLSRSIHWLESECVTYDIPVFVGALIVLLPILIVPLFGVLLLLPATRSVALFLLQENHPVETLTFVLLFTGSLYGIRLAWLAKSAGEPPVIWIFVGVFAFGLFVVAMEEIAWGQQYLGFGTPEFFSSRNVQGELTIHNIEGLQGNSEIFRLMFGIGGLAGVGIRRYSALRTISAADLLLPFFLVITAVSAIDAYNDFYSLGHRLDRVLQRLSELIEMLIGCSALAYLVFLARRFRKTWS